MTIANAMVKTKRIMNLPAIIPTNHHQKLPQKWLNLLRQRVPILLFYTLFSSLLFFKFMRIQEVRELSFNYFICLSVIRLFFYASFCRVGRFRFRGDNGVGFRTNKVYEKNTLWTQYSRKILSEPLTARPCLSVKNP